MKKRVCLIILLLIMLLINAHYFNKLEYYSDGGKKYVCAYNINNSEFNINYDYVYNINTDNFGHIIDSEYYEEFTYDDDYYYSSSKDYYINNFNGFEISYDDSKKVIKLFRNGILNNSENDYNSFKKYIEDANFKCEEQL